MRLRLAGVAALLVAVGLPSGCTSRPHAGVTPGKPVVRGGSPAIRSAPIYTVSTYVQISPAGAGLLCGPIEAAAGGPPRPCGRITVVGMPAARIRGSRTINGYTITPSLQLTGRWEPPRLVLTTAPTPTTQFQQLLPPCEPGSHAGGSRPDPRIAHRIADDLATIRAAGTDVYEIATCGSVVMVAVPVADATTRQWFRARYGAHVELFGWLQPAGAQGHISGVLLISPPMSGDYPTRGLVLVDGQVSSRSIVGRDGRFTVTLPPGRYRVTGHSPLYGNGRYLCQPVDHRAVVVTAGTTLTTQVVCVEK